MRDFDDLFNDFFENRKPKVNPFHEEIKKIIESLTTFNQTTNETKLEDELGKPDEVNLYIENGIKFKQMIWDTPNGRMIKIVVSEAVEEEKKLTLQEQLDDALDKEDYESAIILRDKIKKEKINAKKTC